MAALSHSLAAVVAVLVAGAAPAAADSIAVDRDAPIADVTSGNPFKGGLDTDIGTGLDGADDDLLVDRQDALLGDVNPAPGRDIIDAPDVDEVPETGEVDREKDPIPDDVEILPDRRGFEN